MGMTTTFDTSFFTGGSVSNEVPDRFDMSLDGRGYMFYKFPDTPLENRPVYTRTPIPLLAPQQDASGGFGERSLSNEELVRRSQDSWDHGAGQTFLDRDDSDNRRFRTSKGVDVWERWAMQLLPDTTQKLASANTNLYLAVAGTRLYALDGTALKYTTDLTGSPTWTGVTGMPGTAGSGIASDGFNVWTAHAASGIYGTTRTGGAVAQIVTSTVDRVGYAKGRLMAAAGPSLYNVTNLVGPAALPAALFTHPNVDWLWVGFAAGQSGIYAAGYSGDKSAVYRITVKADGAGLDVPTEAAPMLDGEIITSIDTYAGGIVLVGTTLGLRLCVELSDGNLSVGSPIETTSPVLCFEGQGRFVWYGLTNYDTLSTGLGRLDPSVFPNPSTAPLEPAYASDLMVTGQGSVLSCVTFQNRRVFTVSGLGVYRESGNKVGSGTLDTGLIAYGIPDPKVGMFVDVKVRQPVDSNRCYVSVDSGPFVLVGTRSTTTVDPFQVGQKIGETFELRHELVNADADATAGPILTRWTLRAYPNPHQGEVIGVILDLHENVLNALSGETVRDPQQEYALIQALQASRQLVQLQFAQASLTVMVDAHQFKALTRTATGRGWNGICELSLKSTAI